ncbi:hypothetical protein MUG91_G43n20 [Manis pentadactyla]|nr:hypothetical protein MUG91_G43n20 [Manis pentadactyla]
MLTNLKRGTPAPAKTGAIPKRRHLGSPNLWCGRHRCAPALTSLFGPSLLDKGQMFKLVFQQEFCLCTTRQNLINSSTEPEWSFEGNLKKMCEQSVLICNATSLFPCAFHTGLSGGARIRQTEVSLKAQLILGELQPKAVFPYPLGGLRFSSLPLSGTPERQTSEWPSGRS